MTRPVLSLGRLSLHESEAKISYRFGQMSAEQEAQDLFMVADPSVEYFP